MCIRDSPLAKAIVEEATARGIDFNSGDGFTSIRGKGAYATYAGQKVYVGSRDLFLGIGSGIPGSLMDKASHFKNLGKTVVYIGSETEALGLLVLSDAIRSEAREAISRLREHGIETVMPVSYTHLDVYKRQVNSSFFLDSVYDFLASGTLANHSFQAKLAN